MKTSISHLAKRAYYALAAASILSVTPSFALAEQQPPSCPASNLLAEWEKTKPEYYAQIRAKADATPNGKNIFWKIENDGAPTSYLLGTVHISNPRVTSLPAVVEEAYKSVDNVVLELAEAVDAQKLNAAMMERADLLMAKPGSDLKEFIGSDAVEGLDRLLKERGLAFEVAASLNPVIVYTMVALPACEFRLQASGAPFLDRAIGQAAVKDGKTLSGLETPVEQLEVFASLDDDFVRESLRSAVSLGDRLDTLTATTVELYLNEDIGAIMPMMEKATEEFTPDAELDAGYAAFPEALIDKRNVTMAERAVKHLEDGPTLIAVGALHIPGKAGLVELLRAKGYTLTAVPISR